MVVVAWSNLVSAQGPLVLGLGLKGLGLRVWGQGLTIIDYSMHGIIIVPIHINIFIDSVVFDSFSSWRLRRTIQGDGITVGLAFL